VDVYDLERARGLQALRGLTDPVALVAFSPSGKLVAALTHNWQVALWNVESGQLLHVLEVPVGMSADNAALRFNADDNRFAFAAGNSARLWEVETGKEVGSWGLPWGLVDRLAFQADGKLLLFRVETEHNVPPFGNVDWRRHPRVCRIRNLATGGRPEPLAEIKTFACHVDSAVLSRDGQHVVVQGLGADGEPTIRMYATLTDKELKKIEQKRPDLGVALALDPGGELLVVGSEGDRSAVLLNFPSLEFAGKLDDKPRALGPAAELWVRDHSDRQFALVRRKDGAVLVPFSADTVTAPGVFDKAGTQWVWGHRDGRVTVCDVNTVRQRLAEINLGW
jgi:WD40 repeat protein